MDGDPNKYMQYVYAYIYNIIIIIIRATAWAWSGCAYICVYRRVHMVDVTAILSWPFILTVFTSTFYAAGLFRSGCVASGNYNGACVFRIIHTVKSQDTYEQAAKDKNGQWVCAYICEDVVLTVPAFLVFVTPEVLVTYFLFVKLIFYAGRGILTHIIQRIQIPKCRWW